MSGSNEGTPFSFHCMICFEEFHPEDRYPVVLPCGHTYVCNCCANRLDRCMECRTPLFELVPQSKRTTGHTNSPSWSSGRASTRNGQETPPPPQPPMKRRLALPKNVVLLSLIEAMELASAGARLKYTESPRRSSDSSDGNDGASILASGPSIPDLQSRGSMLDVEEEEEEKIKISTSLAVGVAGTYAVAAKDGLKIYPNRPSGQNGVEAETLRHEEDVDNLVRVYHLDQANSSRDDDVELNHSPDKSRNKKDPLKLCFGDRVQVVSVDVGWAKLARGYGFVQADNNKLVKVGGTVDRACKLESILCSLSNRKKALRLEQSKIDNEFIRFMNELQHSLQNDEDLTVILADTFSAPVDNSKLDISTVEKEEKSPAPEERNDYPQKPPRPVTPPVESSRAGRFACFAGGVFGDDGGGDSREQATATLRSAWESPEFSLLRLGGSQDSDTNDASRLFAVNSHPSPSAMRAGAQAWREQHGRTASTDSSINFRTGMSGHMALLSTHAHPHEYLEPTWMSRQTSTRMMSSHTGLTIPKMPSLQGILNSLTLPASATNTPPRRENNGAIHHSGSM